uniref:Uncharacterized protein n=1 Tax=Octopus bimaculoides TaxID=37653 RepID=A0A0L8H2X8_OCTBM
MVSLNAKGLNLDTNSETIEPRGNTSVSCQLMVMQTVHKKSKLFCCEEEKKKKYFRLKTLISIDWWSPVLFDYEMSSN